MSRSSEIHEDESVGAALDFTGYRHAVSRSVVALSIQSERRDAFRGALGAAETGDIHVFDIAADEHAVHRTRALISRVPQQYLKFSLIERGNGIIVQEGRETRLGPGDMAIYDTDKPYSMLFDSAMHMSVVMFPKALLDVPPEMLARITATRLDDAGHVGPLIRPYLAALARDAGSLDGIVARRLFRTAVDMVGTLVSANLARSGASAHDLLMQRILDHIDQHLDDPDLNPGRIAAAHFISVRHLHGLFGEQGTTVSTIIRGRRLERCYDELVDARFADRSIASIALGHGFVDAAHFSRTFRAHFGVSPSAVRA